MVILPIKRTMITLPFVGFPVKQINYSGKTVAKSPQSMGHISIEYRPSYLPTTLFELEWNHLGQYYTDGNQYSNISWAFAF